MHQELALEENFDVVDHPHQEEIDALQDWWNNVVENVANSREARDVLQWIEQWKQQHGGEHPFHNTEVTEDNANQVLYEEMLVGNYKAVNFAEGIDMSGSTAEFLTG